MEQIIEADVADLKARVKILEGQASELFQRVNTTEGNQKTVAQKLDDMLVTLGEVKNAVNTLQGMPARRWESLIAAVIAAVAGGFIGHFIR